MTLSDKIGDVGDDWDKALKTKYVKEFIKELRKYCDEYADNVKRINPIIMKMIIDKAAGEKLI